MKRNRYVPLLALAFVLAACGGGSTTPPGQGSTPTLSGVSPDPVLRGTALHITGAHFGPTRTSSVVKIGEVEVSQYVSWSDTELQVVTSSTTPLGNEAVLVSVGGVPSAPATLKVVTPAVKSLAGGGNHSLTVKSNGTVAAWGLKTSGQTPIPAGLSNVVAVAAGFDYNLALKSDGTIVAWGSNFYGQTTVPAGLSNVVAVAGGLSHSLALKSDGTVMAWGDNYFGQVTVPAGLIALLR